MKFRCEKDVLVEALSFTSNATPQRPISPALTGLRLALTGDQLEITGTDLDLTISATLEVAGEKDGVVVIPAKVAVEIGRALESGAVTVEEQLDDRGLASVTLTSGSSTFVLRTSPADEMVVKAPLSGDAVTINATEFASGLKQVVKAAAVEEGRHGRVFTGVLLEARSSGLRMVATDTFRLAVRDLPGTSAFADGNNVIVPSRALTELLRMVGTHEEIELVLGEREAQFTVGNLRLQTLLIDGEFADYERLIPESQPNRLIVDREDFISAVRRVRLMTRDGASVHLSLGGETLEIEAQHPDLGKAQATIEADYTGDEFVIAFKAERLLDGLEVMTDELVLIESTEPGRAALLRPAESDTFLYLLMPVRVS